MWFSKLLEKESDLRTNFDTTEAAIKIKCLNKMTALGMPISKKIVAWLLQKITEGLSKLFMQQRHLEIKASIFSIEIGLLFL